MPSASVTPEKRFAGSWAWLLPLAFLLHIAEENWVGEGFPAWMSRLAGVEFTVERFLQINGFGWGLMFIGVILALSFKPLEWLLTSLGTAVLINGLAHLLGSIVTRSYSPGLISGLLLWLPLGAFTLRRAWRLTSRRAFWAGALVGFGLHAIVALLAFNGGRP